MNVLLVVNGLPRRRWGKQLSLFGELVSGCPRCSSVGYSPASVVIETELWCHIILTEHILLTDSDPLGRSIGNHCLNSNSVHHSWSASQPCGNQIPAFRLKLVRLI